MKCVKCGNEMPDDAKFCMNCGAPNPGFNGAGDQNSSNMSGNSTGSQNAGGYWQNGQYIKGQNPNPNSYVNNNKKGGGCLKVALIVIGVFVGLSILAVACNVVLSGDDSSSQNSKNSKATSEEVKTQDKTEEAVSTESEDKTEAETAEEKNTEQKTTEEKKKEKDTFDPSEYRTDISFDSFSRKPDDFIGKKMKLSGKVIETFGSGADSGLRVELDIEHFDDLIRVYYNSNNLDIRILEDDEVTIYGVYQGIESYEAVLGNIIDIPYFNADKIEVDSYVSEAASPSGELRTGKYEEMYQEDGLAVSKVAEITFQDGEAYGIHLFANEMDVATHTNNKCGDITCFLKDEGNGKYTGVVDIKGSITITAYEDHFNVVCNPNAGNEYDFSKLDGDYYYGDHTSSSGGVTETPRGDDSEYILPNSDSQYLSDADISGMDADKLALARNEIFARHGYKFQDPTFANYFASKSWYTPLYGADEFSDSVFNEYERKNIEFIKNHE